MAGDCVVRSYEGTGGMQDASCFRDNFFNQPEGSRHHPDCIYCNNISQADNAGGATCQLTPDPGGANAGPQCSAGADDVGNTPVAGRSKIMVPGFLVTPISPDCTGDTTPFWANTRPEDIAASFFSIANVRGNPRFYLTPLVKAMVDPCHGPFPTNTESFFDGDNRSYCCLDNNSGQRLPGNCFTFNAALFWLCRIFLMYVDSKGWSMQCIRPHNIEQWVLDEDGTVPLQPPEQKIQTGNRPFEYTTISDILGFVHFAGGSEPPCAQMQDQYCLSDGCDTDLWGCDGKSGGNLQNREDRMDAWETIRFDPGVSYSTDNNVHPHPTGYIATLNDAWATFRALNDQWQMTHSHTGSSFERLSPNLWAAGYEFTEEGIPENQSFIPTFPVVREGGDLSADPITVTIKSRLTPLAIPAQWHIQNWEGSIRLNLEQGPQLPNARFSYRIGTVIRLAMNMRVRPIDTPANRALLDDYGFTLADPDAFWTDGDLRVLAKADPTGQADPTLEHRHESLYPVGSDGQRIPHQSPTAAERINEGVLLWRGMIGPRPYAVGDYDFRQGSSTNDAHFTYKCCESMHRVHGLVVPGWVNDFNDPLGVQQYTGDVVMLIEDIASGAMANCLK